MSTPPSPPRRANSPSSSSSSALLQSYGRRPGSPGRTRLDRVSVLSSSGGPAPAPPAVGTSSTTPKPEECVDERPRGGLLADGAADRQPWAGGEDNDGDDISRSPQEELVRLSAAQSSSRPASVSGTTNRYRRVPPYGSQVAGHGRDVGPPGVPRSVDTPPSFTPRRPTPPQSLQQRRAHRSFPWVRVDGLAQFSSLPAAVRRLF